MSSASVADEHHKPSRLAAETICCLWRAGRVPRGGGTLGALIALPFAVGCAALPWPWQVMATLAVTAFGFFYCLRYVGNSADDPQEVVLDEFVGCLIAVQFVPLTGPWIAAAFVLFRVLDIAKPWPVGYIDQNIHGGLGVMLDDVVAGLLAGTALFAICRLI